MRLRVAFVVIGSASIYLEQSACITLYAARNPFTIENMHRIASATLELPTAHPERRD